MPYTVAVSFEKFLENINITGDHRETAKTRKDRIISLLTNDFTILDAFATGSIPRYTALKGLADLDVIVVLHFGKHIDGKTPEQVLQAVRDSLGQYRTSVRKNGQAVTLQYDSWPNVDIVPVSRTVNGDGSVNYYNVPDTNTNGWLVSRPRKHSNDLDAKSSECGSKFRQIIKMIKQWNVAHSNLLQSYHIEVMALNIFTGDISDFTWGVFQYFDKATTLAAAPLLHESGYADNYLDWSTRPEVVKRLETARDRARNAWYETYNGREHHKEAIEIWRQIFGDKFPAYGS